MALYEGVEDEELFELGNRETSRTDHAKNNTGTMGYGADHDAVLKPEVLAHAAGHCCRANAHTRGERVSGARSGASGYRNLPTMLTPSRSYWPAWSLPPRAHVKVSTESSRSSRLTLYNRAGHLTLIVGQVGGQDVQLPRGSSVH
jgi:hypothetical protein